MKNIDPLNPEEVKTALAQDSTNNQPVSSPEPSTQNTPQLPPAPAPTLSSQAPPTSTLDADEKKRKRYKIINLTILAVVIIVIFLTGWHFLGSPDIKPVKTIVDKFKSNNSSIQNEASEAANIDTSDWHTASNDKFNYTYKYPTDDNKRIWRFYENEGKEYFYGGVESGLATIPNYYPLPVFSVEIMPVGSRDYEANIKYFSRANIEKINQENVKDFTIKKENVTKNNINGACYERVFTKTANWNFTTCWFSYKNNGYLLDINGYGSDKVEQEYKGTGVYSIPAIGQKMYDSFQFI